MMVRPHIAKFFMDSQNGFKIHTCHYCDTAYVNVYEALADYPIVLDLVNKASREEYNNYHKVEALRLQDLLADYSGYKTFRRRFVFGGNENVRSTAYLT